MAGLDDIPGSDGPATRVFHAPAELGRGVVLVGRYEVERVLGEGGMGVVLAATDRVAGRRVALKFLLPDVARDEAVRARFQREAQAASALACDHVVQVFDVGILESGSPFIAMELLEGEDLAAAVERRGPLPVQEAVDHVLEALVAVGLAHLRGIAHRDLKPANLFLTRREDGRPVVKVLDFGLSKSAQSPENLSLTKTGHGAMGTPLYMAPEQIRSLKSASSASDVWAMGVIAFELTTGRVPFDGESLGALFAAISADEPLRLAELRPDAPPALGEAIARCLAKKPADRPSPLELAGWLVPLAGDRGRDAYQRLKHDFVAAGAAPAVAATVVDEASFAPAPAHGTFAMTLGAPTTQLSVSNHMATPPPSVVPGTRSSSPAPAPARSGAGRSVVIAFVLAFGGAAAVMGWWLTARQAPAGGATPTAAPEGGATVAAPEATTPSPPASATAPEITPSAEAPPPPPDASAAPTSASSTSASAAPASAPRPPRPRTPPPPPTSTSKSIDDLIKKGRR